MMEIQRNDVKNLLYSRTLLLMMLLLSQTWKQVFIFFLNFCKQTNSMFSHLPCSVEVFQFAILPAKQTFCLLNFVLWF